MPSSFTACASARPPGVGINVIGPSGSLYQAAAEGAPVLPTTIPESLMARAIVSVAAKPGALPRSETVPASRSNDTAVPAAKVDLDSPTATSPLFTAYAPVPTAPVRPARADSDEAPAGRRNASLPDTPTMVPASLVPSATEVGAVRVPSASGTGAATTGAGEAAPAVPLAARPRSTIAAPTTCRHRGASQRGPPGFVTSASESSREMERRTLAGTSAPAPLAPHEPSGDPGPMSAHGNQASGNQNFGTGDPHDFLEIGTLLDDEERLLRDTVRQFVDDRILPDVADWFEEGTFPKDMAKEMGALGLLGMHLEGYGCAGTSAVAYGLACLELEAGDSGFRSFVSVQGSLAMFPIRAYGSDEQKDEWLPRMSAGEAVGCFGLTEPDSGSDPSSMRTNARRDG